MTFGAVFLPVRRFANQSDERPTATAGHGPLLGLPCQGWFVGSSAYRDEPAQTNHLPPRRTDDGPETIGHQVPRGLLAQRRHHGAVTFTAYPTRPTTWPIAGARIAETAGIRLDCEPCNGLRVRCAGRL